MIGVGDTRLHTYEWGATSGASASPRAVLVLAHGYSEHAGRYDRLAGELASLGYATIALDHRGHGRSEGPRATCARFDDFTDDYASLVSWARARYPEVPLYALGHSMGSLVALRYALGDTGGGVLAGLVVSGVALRPAREVLSPLRPPIQRLVGLLARYRPELPIVPPRLSRLCGDPDVVAAFRDDELCYRGFVRARLVDQLLAAAEDAAARLHELRLPLLILHGARDVVTDPRGARQLHECAASTDKTLAVFAGLDHEVLFEKGSPAIPTLAGWLDARPDTRARSLRPVRKAGRVCEQPALNYAATRGRRRTRALLVRTRAQDELRRDGPQVAPDGRPPALCHASAHDAALPCDKLPLAAPGQVIPPGWAADASAGSATSGPLPTSGQGEASRRRRAVSRPAPPSRIAEAEGKKAAPTA